MREIGQSIPLKALFAGRNLEESGGICDRMNIVFHPCTVKSDWFFNQPNEPIISKLFFCRLCTEGMASIG